MTIENEEKYQHAVMQFKSLAELPDEERDEGASSISRLRWSLTKRALYRQLND